MMIFAARYKLKLLVCFSFKPGEFTSSLAHFSDAYDPAPTSGFFEDALVVVFVGGDDVVGAEIVLGVDAGDWVFSPPKMRLTLLVL
jgi:hypothetical protein